jgi:hypothetical protein
MRIAGDCTGPAFDFHEEKPAVAEYRRVYLVHLAVIIDEFKVRPSIHGSQLGSSARNQSRASRSQGN